MNTSCSIFLDSGAFSAWRQGVSVNLDDYIRYVKRHEHLVTNYVTLDSIPGQEGRRERDPVKIEEAAAQSYSNLKSMQAAGLHPVGAFHQDEQFAWLKRMLDDGADCIALSPYASADPSDILRWLDTCFGMIGNGIKAHGLGLSSVLLCQHHPWTSADSTSWWQAAGNGTIPIPRIASDGRWDYGVSPEKVAVTDGRRSSSHHVDWLSADRVQHIKRYLSEVGVEIARVRYDLSGRYRAWLYYFRGMEAYCAARNGAFEIVYVTDTSSAIQRTALDAAGIQRRLLSFYELNQARREDALERYVSGAPRSSRKRKPPQMNFYSDAYVRWRALGLHDRNVAYEARDLEWREQK